MVGTSQAGATRPSQIAVTPDPVATHAAVTVDIYCLRPAEAPPLAPTATSPGFATSITLREAGDGSTGGRAFRRTGTGPATATPGRYAVTYDCWRWVVRAEFVVS
ncbi:hypothetical protein [Actinokineospora sp. NBRC 105648]|uniref:hypothetical protein n=1 Tax=Actinokineospora sp. NBRC 105648 TaxID=3032206 RepID=UPI0024A41944|nr:hypothetical protein [Actinokineospora sp. NBRC 105648]GLZ36724.1 hypothetical protein Acsp05_03490 [Actinokineospora sp. NBRC 105648]